MKNATFLFTALLLLVSANSRKLPSYIKRCKKDNSNADVCVKDAVDILRPKLATGVAELGIPPCEPLVIPSLDLSQPNSGNVGFVASLKELKLFGGTKFELQKSIIDVQKDTVEITLHFPKLNMEGDYKAKGRVLVVDFQGHGQISGEFDNVVYTGFWQTKRVKRGKKEYLEIVDHKSNVDIKGLKANFENIVDGNKQLSQEVNILLAENKQQLFNDIKPIVVETISSIVNNVVNFCLKQFSYNELFED